MLQWLCGKQLRVGVNYAMGSTKDSSRVQSNALLGYAD